MAIKINVTIIGNCIICIICLLLVQCKKDYAFPSQSFIRLVDGNLIYDYSGEEVFGINPSSSSPTVANTGLIEIVLTNFIPNGRPVFGVEIDGMTGQRTGNFHIVGGGENFSDVSSDLTYMVDQQFDNENRFNIQHQKGTNWDGDFAFHVINANDPTDKKVLAGTYAVVTD